MSNKINFTMAKAQWIFYLLTFFLCIQSAPVKCAQTSSINSKAVMMFPADKAQDVNPDTHLVLTFPSKPTLGKSGKISIYDAADDRLVDILDMSIPPGPTKSNRARVPYTEVPYVYIPGHWTNANTKPGTPSGTALPTPDNYQLTIIGGFTDGFHFYPVIIHDNVATIYLHHNLLEYNKTYYVQIDPGVLILDNGSFNGVIGKTRWTFSTKKTPPPADSKWLVVSGDGTGDFNTVQGAIDFLPDYNPKRVTIFIKNGIYEEIVYFRHKANITILGEDREKVKVCYANNEVLNPHPANITTNHWPGTFPSRRAAFMVDHSSGIHLVNFTIESLNPKPAQAEGLLLVGERHIVSNVTNIGSGDSLQVNGSAYFTDSSNTGWGHNILGRGPAFFNRCDHISTFGPHILVRNTSANHGYVFLNCKFWTTGDFDTTFAQARAVPSNHAYVEAVLLNCALEDIRPHGWDIAGDDTADIHYWEYNSTNLSNGKPADISQRHPASRQLTMENDAEIIANYSNPTYVLGGWTPKMVPIILSQPEPVIVAAGQTTIFSVKVTAIPDATYQWFKDGTAIEDATNEMLKIDNVNTSDAGTYAVTAKNDSGSITSIAVTLKVKK
ncbi:MAG: immunoglobulin domain-containing protein [Sedimentisphaerales bacterium]|nr:immunoglobulin domain-containing protein [Sedimentisphaerales bacterium]